LYSRSCLVDESLLRDGLPEDYYKVPTSPCSQLILFPPLSTTLNSRTPSTLSTYTPTSTQPNPNQLKHSINMSDAQPSTLKSIVDSTTGAVQNAIGSITGNTSDQAAGDLKKQKAEAEHDASHATAKLPGATISGSGAAARDDPNRTEGSWNQTAGSAKETIGGLIGNEVS
jgi:uncharacterized protein YjbJ (UPF0337 family)